MDKKNLVNALEKDKLYELKYLELVKEIKQHPLLQKKSYQDILNRIEREADNHARLFDKMKDKIKIKSEANDKLWYLRINNIEKITKKSRTNPFELLNDQLFEEVEIRKLYEYQLTLIKDKSIREILTSIINEEKNHERLVREMIEELQKSF